MTAAPVEARGSTAFPARVVERIAAQAASEVAGVGSGAGGILGVGARRDFSGRPEAECDLYGRIAVLRLDVGMSFPLALAEALGALRRHVTARVEELTGLEVGRLDVEVSWLNPQRTGRRDLR